jgi:PEP-CTERM motif
MKKFLIAASLAAIPAVLWSMPASAEALREARDHEPFFGVDTNHSNYGANDPGTPTTGVPEPGTIVLFALGLGYLGFVTLRRKRARV